MAIDTLETGTPETSATAAPVRSRRALLTAAFGGLGGLFAARLGAPGPAAAAAGDPLIIGNTGNTAGTANTTLTTASAGTALLVTQNGTGTALRGSAVGAGSIAGFFTANNGTGVSGVTGNPASYGVFGSNDGAGGAGGAIRADGNANNGLVASTDSATKVALKASNSVAGGTAALFENSLALGGPAIRAYTGSGADAHVHPGGAYADAAGEFAGINGIIAATNAAGSFAHAVLGLAPAGTGVRGDSTTGTGVWGTTDNNIGVYGHSNTGHAVLGESISGYAVYSDGPAHFVRHLDIREEAAPPNASTNTARMFVRDNGGKTELCVIFPTGVVQVIKTEA